MNKEDAPCLGCQDRYLGCHDRCKRYKAFKEKSQKVKEEREEYYYQRYGRKTRY